MSALEVALCAVAVAGPAWLVLADLRPRPAPVPEAEVPEADAPDTEVADPDVTEPDVLGPDVPDPDVPDPDVAALDVADPDVADPAPVAVATLPAYDELSLEGYQAPEPALEVQAAPTEPVTAPLESPAAPEELPEEPQAARTTSMLEGLGAVESDPGPPAWRRLSSAMALLVMTLVVAGAMGAGIYRGLLALKP